MQVFIFKQDLHLILTPVYTVILMMKCSKWLPVLLLITTVAIGASAQQRFSFSNTPVVDDVTGKPIPVNTYMHIKGSPFIFDEWLPGQVLTAEGKVHTGMLLKYNIETNLLSFVYKPEEEPLQFAEPIREFTIFGERKMRFANNFPKIDGYGKNAYYEVIASGKATLLKHYRQFLKDTRSSVDLSMTDGTYVQTVDYYIFKDGKMARIKPNTKTIEEAFADRSAQVDSFLVEKNIHVEDEADLKMVFDYYNSL